MTGKPKPVVGVMAVVFKDGKFLLVRRSKDPDTGRRSFPAGKIESGETIRDAAIRELSEETGVSAKFGDVLTAVDAIELEAIANRLGSEQERDHQPIARVAALLIVCEAVRAPWLRHPHPSVQRMTLSSSCPY